MTEIQRRHREAAVAAFGWADAIGTENRVSKWVTSGDPLDAFDGVLPIVAQALADAEAHGDVTLTLPDHSFIDASELASAGTIVGVQGEDFDLAEQVALRTRDVLPGEVDEDPEDGEADEKLARLESALGFLCSRDVLVTHTEANGDTYSQCPEAASLLLMATGLGWDGKAGA